MVQTRRISLAAVVTASSAGTAYRLLIEQSKHARRKIGPPSSLAPRADGVYEPHSAEPAPGGAVLDPGTGPDTNLLTLGVFGDSTAAGLGCVTAAELPGVLLARGLTEETGRPVQLRTYAVVGANSTTLDDQISLALTEQNGHAPDAAVIFIGANDVTSKQSVQASADRLGAAVARLRALGTAVVAGTCPDLGAVRPIPQPLRSVVRSWSLRLAKAQSVAITAAGGCAVPLADLLSPEFLTRPEVFFSADQFHPSAAGYEAAATLMLPAVCTELGVWGGPPLADLPVRSVTAEARRPTSRLTAALNQNLNQRARTGGRWATELLRRADVRRRGKAPSTDQ